jgi:hypothetical protein
MTTTFITKITESPILAVEAFYQKNITDCRRIQYGEYQAEEPGESLLRFKLIVATWKFL